MTMQGHFVTALFDVNVIVQWTMHLSCTVSDI